MNAPSPIPFLPYARQSVDESDIAAVTAVLRGDYLTTGPEVEAFEAALCGVTGAPRAIACSNGTAALHLAARALGIGPGQSVIVPSITFLATANAPALEGADVVFADVDTASGLMTPQTLIDALARAPSRPSAVFNVHLAGQAGDVAGIAEVARGAGLAIVEDAAHALGARYAAGPGARHQVGACDHCDLVTFSFHPTKIATMGEGGAVTTRDPVLAARLRDDRCHGLTRDPARFGEAALALGMEGRVNPWYYEMAAPGLNYRASDLQCALGRSQLLRLADFLATRRALATGYDTRLAPLAEIVRPLARVPGAESAWHLYVVRIDFEAAGLTRGAVMRALAAHGIGTQVHYIPVHRQPYYRARAPRLHLPGAEAYYAECLSLPMWSGLGESELDRVVCALADALR
ncbi:MAG: UDP-4-amino-4,6-dideoxy-N-acetyl-beta-L-altrosamine transaminase [Alphaproteobacteria bacterium]|nr:UDP-4-amino-4,6-dideoxy-N-acetyl-beta-L-altrosamine transaminase [Alphaproteobacteria bacterium]